MRTPQEMIASLEKTAERHEKCCDSAKDKVAKQETIIQTHKERAAKALADYHRHLANAEKAEAKQKELAAKCITWMQKVKKVRDDIAARKAKLNSATTSQQQTAKERIAKQSKPQVSLNGETLKPTSELAIYLNIIAGRSLSACPLLKDGEYRVTVGDNHYNLLVCDETALCEAA